MFDYSIVAFNRRFFCFIVQMIMEMALKFLRLNGISKSKLVNIIDNEHRSIFTVINRSFLVRDWGA